MDFVVCRPSREWTLTKIATLFLTSKIGFPEWYASVLRRTLSYLFTPLWVTLVSSWPHRLRAERQWPDVTGNVLLVVGGPGSGSNVMSSGIEEFLHV